MSSGKWRPFCLGLNVLTHMMQICMHTAAIINVVSVACQTHKRKYIVDFLISIEKHILLVCSKSTILTSRQYFLNGH